MTKSRPAKIALVFLALGPVVAYAVLLPLALLQVALVRDGGFGLTVSRWVAGLAGFRDFYVTALVPAAFATVAALLMAGRRDAAFVIGSALAGAVAALALTLLFGANLDLPIDGRYGYALVGALAAGVCALITRR